MDLEELIYNLMKGVQVSAVICDQFGDTGKGKISDLIAAFWADIDARGTGGNNAGHTVVLNGVQRVFHLIPAGIAYDKDGKINILGNGMVIDPVGLAKEMAELDNAGISYNHLMVSDRASVTMPFHIAADKAKDQSLKSGGIGSTGRGIGPTYTDKIARRGIMMRDLLDRDSLVKKIEKVRELYGVNMGSTDEIISSLTPAIEKIRPYIRDTVVEMHNFLRQGKKVVLEGAQGLLLSIEHGTYPYVTSSDCSVNGTASGVGISAGDIDLTLGIVKFPFMTRVGGGPFPTELGGKVSEDYCARDMGNRRDDEKKNFNNPQEMINSSNSDFQRGVGIRMLTGEYGATTGRPRRVGWTDAVAARYAAGINGTKRQKLVLTKVDALDGIDNFNLCFGYRLSDGKKTEEFPNDSLVLREVKPLYETFEGYSGVRGLTNYEEIPEGLRQSIKRFEEFVGIPVGIISTGPEAKETIVL